MRLRALLLRLGLALGATALSLGVAEVGYRVHRARLPDSTTGDWAWYQRMRRLNHTIYQPSDDPELVYVPHPGAGLEMSYGWAGFSSQSMRDDRLHAAQPSGRRVALVGDSVAWGEELPLEQSPGRALERALGDEVLPFGVSGYDTVQEARWYEVAVRPWRSTDVVVLLCLNDALIMSGPWGAWGGEEAAAAKQAQEAWLDRVAPVRAETLDRLQREREERALLRLPAHLDALWRRARFERGDAYTDELLLSWADPQRAARVEAALQRLGAAIRADGARPWLVISPVLKRWEDYPWEGLHAQVRAMGEAAGFQVVDPLPEWRGALDPARLRFDSLHYSGRGAEALARVVADALEAPPTAP